MTVPFERWLIHCVVVVNAGTAREAGATVAAVVQVSIGPGKGGT